MKTKPVDKTRTLIPIHYLPGSSPATAPNFRAKRATGLAAAGVLLALALMAPAAEDAKWALDEVVVTCLPADLVTCEKVTDGEAPGRTALEVTLIGDETHPWPQILIRLPKDKLKDEHDGIALGVMLVEPSKDRHGTGIEFLWSTEEVKLPARYLSQELNAGGGSSVDCMFDFKTHANLTKASELRFYVKNPPIKYRLKLSNIRYITVDR